MNVKNNFFVDHFKETLVRDFYPCFLSDFNSLGPFCNYGFIFAELLLILAYKKMSSKVLKINFKFIIF